MASSSSNWTRAQNEKFEKALVTYAEDTPDRWDNIAKITGKTVEEVKIHYQELLDDLNAIESGLVPLPDYKDAAAKEYLTRSAKK